MNVRLRNFADYLISVKKVKNYTDLADKIGSDVYQLSGMFSGKRTISDKTINSLISCYPELNENWLRKGEGEMLKQKEIVNNNSNVNKIKIDINNQRKSKEDLTNVKTEGEILRLQANIEKLEMQLQITQQMLNEEKERTKDAYALADKYLTMIQQLTIK